MDLFVFVFCSIQEFVENCSNDVTCMVDHLLNMLTDHDHAKTKQMLNPVRTGKKTYSHPFKPLSIVFQKATVSGINPINPISSEVGIYTVHESEWLMSF